MSQNYTLHKKEWAATIFMNASGWTSLGIGVRPPDVVTGLKELLPLRLKFSQSVSCALMNET